MTTEIDTEAAQERVQAILEGASMFKPSTVSSQAPAQPVTRKKRSDAGQPKKPSTSATLTIQFDLSENSGREMFAKTLKFWAENGEMEAVKQIAEQFAKKVDAISKQK